MSDISKAEDLVPPGFRRIEEGNAVLVVREVWAEAAHRVLAPLYQAWARIAQRRFTAQGRAGIVSFPLGKDLPVMMVRRYVHGGLWARVGRDLHWGMDRALAELIVAESAKRGGVRTPDPIGVLGQRVYGPFWRLAFLSAEVTESEDLIHYGCRVSEYPAETAALEKRGVIREAALQIRKMHDLGIDHADLHLKNLLLRRRADNTPEVYLLDFDRASCGPPLDSDRRLKNLKRLARSVRKVRIADTVLTAWDRLRFVRDYVHGQAEAHALMRRWARRLASSGRAHEAWWTATGAKRNLRGDGLGTLASVSKLAGPLFDGNPPMKIALTDSHLDPARGGAQTYIRNFARRLVRDGHEVHVYAASPDAGEKGIVWRQVSVPPFRALRDYACALRTRDLLMKERFDIVHGFGSSVHMDVYRPGGGVRRSLLEHEARAMGSAAARLWMQVRRVTSLRHRLLLRLEKLQFQPGGAHEIIAVSNRVRDEIIQYYRCEPERITVIHNGADLTRFTSDVRARFRKPARQELGLPNDEIMILLVGNNFKLKGVPQLIRALPMLRQLGASFRLVVVGRGRRAPCERLARKLGVGDLVQFAGSTTQPEKFYAAADIFCLPSFYDPCANALLEALACGLPAVTSATNGSGELLTGNEGCAVPFGDVPQLAQRIGEFFNRDRRAAASAAARALAEAHSSERNFEEVMKVYAKVTERKRASKR